MNRRGFLEGILLAGMTPAIVKASSLMKLTTPQIILPGDPWYTPAGLIRGKVDAIRDHKWSFGDIYDFEGANTNIVMPKINHAWGHGYSSAGQLDIDRVRRQASTLTELRMLGIVAER